MLNDIQNAIASESKITSEFIVSKIFQMEKTLQRLESHLIPASQPITPPPSKGVIKFSINSKLLKPRASLTEVTTSFFQLRITLLDLLWIRRVILGTSLKLINFFYKLIHRLRG